MHTRRAFDLEPYELLRAVSEDCMALDFKYKQDPEAEEPLWVAHNRKFVNDAKK